MNPHRMATSQPNGIMVLCKFCTVLLAVMKTKLFIPFFSAFQLQCSVSLSALSITVHFKIIHVEIFFILT